MKIAVRDREMEEVSSHSTPSRGDRIECVWVQLIVETGSEETPRALDDRSKLVERLQSQPHSGQTRIWLGQMAIDAC